MLSYQKVKQIKKKKESQTRDRIESHKVGNTWKYVKKCTYFGEMKISL